MEDQYYFYPSFILKCDKLFSEHHCPHYLFYKRVPLKLSGTNKYRFTDVMKQSQTVVTVVTLFVKNITVIKNM